MKKLVLGSLIALAATPFTGGCTTSSNDAHLTATWSLKNLATNTATACPTGFDTAALYTQAADASGNPIGTCTTVSGTCFIDLFDCAANAGTSSALPPSNYITWLEIADHSGANVYATSLSNTVDITTVDMATPFEILNDGGYFQLAWNLVAQSNSAPLTCATAGAGGGVEAVATVSGGSQAASDIFTCTDGVGVTAGFLAANYTVSVDALNAQMQSIGTAPAFNSTIQPQNVITNLNTITIPIAGL